MDPADDQTLLPPRCRNYMHSFLRSAWQKHYKLDIKEAALEKKLEEDRLAKLESLDEMDITSPSLSSKRKRGGSAAPSYASNASDSTRLTNKFARTALDDVAGSRGPYTGEKPKFEDVTIGFGNFAIQGDLMSFKKKCVPVAPFWKNSIFDLHECVKAANLPAQACIYSVLSLGGDPTLALYGPVDDGLEFAAEIKKQYQIIDLGYIDTLNFIIVDSEGVQLSIPPQYWNISKLPKQLINIDLAAEQSQTALEEELRRRSTSGRSASATLDSNLYGNAPPPPPPVNPATPLQNAASVPDSTKDSTQHPTQSPEKPKSEPPKAPEQPDTRDPRQP